MSSWRPDPAARVRSGGGAGSEPALVRAGLLPRVRAIVRRALFWRMLAGTVLTGPALFATVLTGTAQAADFPARSLGRPSFAINVVAVPAAAGSVRVDVSWEVAHRELSFRREDDWYRSRYDVAIVFLDDGRQVGGDVWQNRVRLRDFDATRSSEDPVRGKRSLMLPAGNYDVRATLTDRYSQGSSEALGKLRADFVRSGIGLSDLRLVRYREGKAVVNPGHDARVGESDHRVQLELHPAGGAAGSYRLSWWIRDGSKETLASGDSTVTLGSKPLPVEIALPTDSLAIGQLVLEVKAEGPGGASDSRKTLVNVHLGARWFETRRKEALEVLSLVATDEERDRLRAASEGEWADAVREFWKGRDPDPETPENEFRDGVQARMELAATWFVEPFRSPGWRTDRGHILLQHGRPARRAQRSADFERAASELWEYDSPRRTFFFVDVQGTGEFWLRG